MDNRATTPLALLAGLLLLLAGAGETAAQALPAAPAAEVPAPDVPSQADLEGLIATLEDEAARAALIAQLELMLEAEQASAILAEEGPAQALRSLSQEVVAVFNQFLVVGGGIEELPAVGDWLRQQAEQPARRSLWLGILLNLALVLGSGYLALVLLRLLLRRPRRLVAERGNDSFWGRLVLSLVWLVLELIPIAGFVAVAYLVLALVEPATETRLVATAWISAVAIARLVDVLGRALLGSRAPRLRLVPLDDGSARYGEIWIRRLAVLGVYGYVGLLAAKLIGLPEALFAALLRLLGLLVTVLVAVLILRNRKAVARLIAGTGAGDRRRGARQRLAGVWYIPALLYLFLLFALWALAIPDGFAIMMRGTVLTLVVLVIGGAILRLLERYFRDGLRLGPELEQRFPGLEARLNRYVPGVYAGARWVVYGLMTLAILQAWGVDALTWITTGPGGVLLSALIGIALILVISLLVWVIASVAIEGYLNARNGDGGQRVRSARTRTLLTVARTALAVTLSVIVVLLVLSELGVNIAPLLATAGVLGLAVGFGAQKLVQDLITGFFILLEDLFSVGDVIKVDDRAGLVEAVTIRNVRLRDLSGTVHTIPFSSISTVSNLTKEFSFHVFDIGVAYREDTDQVIEVIREVGAELQADPYFAPLILAPVEVFGVDAFGDSAVVIKGRIKTLPIRQWETGREFNRRLKRRFDALGIEIPFPHRTLYFGEAKDGTAPPMRLSPEPGEPAEGAAPPASEAGPRPPRL